MKNIAVFGGTFDPPTRAHEAIIEASLEYPDVDEVWLMPSGCRPDKPAMSSNAARLAMLTLVKQGIFNEDERLKVTDFEQQLTQPTRTYQTVRALEAAYPEDSFWFIYGADAYHAMPDWEHGSQLRRNIGMLLIERGGFELPPETGRLKRLPATKPTRDVSSSEFRQAHLAGRSVEGLVCDAVKDYIVAHSIYPARNAAVS
jgi:nicotinate-nucleotide adenylyltransferase